MYILTLAFTLLQKFRRREEKEKISEACSLLKESLHYFTHMDFISAIVPSPGEILLSMTSFPMYSWGFQHVLYNIASVDWRENKPQDEQQTCHSLSSPAMFDC
jgi:hypothetical protein